MGCRKITYYQAGEAMGKTAFFSGGRLEKKGGALKNRYNYYPFGLTFNSYKREFSKVNKMNTFQDQEYDEETDWVQFKWRNHQPELGRFFNVDPLAEDYYYNSPYAFSENRVIDGIELEGLEWKSVKELNPDGSNTIRYTVQLKVKNSSNMTMKQVKSSAEGIAKQAKNSFRGYDSKTNTYFRTKVELQYDQNASTENGDFFIEFVNKGEVLKKSTQEPYPSNWGVQGSVNQQDGDTQENRIQVQNEAEDIVRTGTHELGHTGGLADPDPSTDRTKDYDGINLEQNNLMQQSQTSNGTYININQLYEILKTLTNDIEN